MAHYKTFEEEHHMWALSPYEEAQQPQSVTKNDTTIRLPFTELSKLMKCPVCLNLLDSTMTMKEVRLASLSATFRSFKVSLPSRSAFIVSAVNVFPKAFAWGKKSVQHVA